MTLRQGCSRGPPHRGSRVSERQPHARRLRVARHSPCPADSASQSGNTLPSSQPGVSPAAPRWGRRGDRATGQPGAREPVTFLLKKEFREESLAGSGHTRLNTSHSAEGNGSSSFHLCYHKQQMLKIHCGLGLHSNRVSPYIIYKAMSSFPFVHGLGD